MAGSPAEVNPDLGPRSGPKPESGPISVPDSGPASSSSSWSSSVPALPALVVGRFQPFHKGHEALIRQALAEFGRVIIAIGSSQEGHTTRNPFTFAERSEMVHAVFGAAVEVVAVPDIHDPPKWVDHLRRITGPFAVVYGNDLDTLELFEVAGHRVVAPGLQHRDIWQARTLRTLIACGDEAWRQGVPLPVASWLDTHTGVARIRALEAA